MGEEEPMDTACEEDPLMEEDDLEKEMWRCLASVDQLLHRRELLHQILRQGWMELVSARYEMGPARISHPLFSLKPQASKAVVGVSLKSAGENIAGALDDNADGEIKGPAVFHLIKDRSESASKGTDVKEAKPTSQLRRRPVFHFSDREKDAILGYSNLVRDSDSEDDTNLLEVQKNTLQGFGALVSPHLRAAQITFSKALQLVVELLNAQSEAVDAHSKLSSLQDGMDKPVGTKVL